MLQYCFNQLNFFCVLFPAVIVITLRYSKCIGHTMPFSDQGSVYNYIYTVCNCTVTSHHTVKLNVKTITCENDITVMNITGTLSRTLCNNTISIDAYPGSELFLKFKPFHRSTALSQIPHQIVSIFSQGPGTCLNFTSCDYFSFFWWFTSFFLESFIKTCFKKTQPIYNSTMF